VAGWWFSPVSSTNKTDHHDITVLKHHNSSPINTLINVLINFIGHSYKKYGRLFNANFSAISWQEQGNFQ